MKSNFIVISVALSASLFAGLSCNNAKIEQENVAPVINANAANQDGPEQTAKQLIEAYNKKDCRNFIKIFPNSFQIFDQLYEYNDAKGEGMLYSTYEEHLSYFSNCPEVADGEKLSKVIVLGVDGRAGTTVTRLLQNLAFKLITAHLDEAKQILDNLPDKKAASFWFFLLDGPPPNDAENVEKFNSLQKILGKDSKQAKLLSGIADKALREPARVELTGSKINTLINLKSEQLSVMGLHLSMTKAQAQACLAKSKTLFSEQDTPERIYIYSKTSDGGKGKAMFYLIWDGRVKLRQLVIYEAVGPYLNENFNKLLTLKSLDVDSPLVKSFLGSSDRSAVTLDITVTGYKHVTYYYDEIGVGLTRMLDKGKDDGVLFAFIPSKL